ncbi:hypothetical protein [Vampirovibrio sp.]|uniref:hypothetical protein n=1 Tax=Vampirovibrio sp. TaxID=2717857 RepID=UPI003593A434
MTESTASTSEIQAMLQSFITTGWLETENHYRIPQDYRGEPLALVTRQDVLRILQRFLTGEWDNQGIGSWGGALFASYGDYITYEAGYGTVIDDVLGRLASFWTSLTAEDVQQYIRILQQAQYDPNDLTT